jgi:hypothetical protein
VLAEEGAVGLEGAELLQAAEERTLGAGLVTGQTLEGGFEGVFEEGVGGFGGQFRFQAADAAEVPGGVDELIEQVVLEGALGIELGLVGGEEVVKLFLFAFADDQVAGGEAVFAGVLGGAGLALGGAGAGGKTSVGGVRRLASCGKHGVLLGKWWRLGGACLSTYRIRGGGKRFGCRGRGGVGNRGDRVVRKL